MSQPLSRIALIAAFALAGAAHAQQAAETTNTPQRAGEASTMTGGAPNAKTSNATTNSSVLGNAATTSDTSTETSKGEKAAAGKASAAATSNVPERAGEASTMTDGAPNKKTTN